MSVKLVEFFIESYWHSHFYCNRLPSVEQEHCLPAVHPKLHVSITDPAITEPTFSLARPNVDNFIDASIVSDVNFFEFSSIPGLYSRL